MSVAQFTLFPLRVMNSVFYRLFIVVQPLECGLSVAVRRDTGFDDYESSIRNSPFLGTPDIFHLQECVQRKRQQRTCASTTSLTSLLADQLLVCQSLFRALSSLEQDLLVKEANLRSLQMAINRCTQYVSNCAPFSNGRTFPNTNKHWTQRKGRETRPEKRGR